MGTLFFMGAMAFCVYFIFQMRDKSASGIKIQYIGGYPGLQGPKNTVLKDEGDSFAFEYVRLYKKDITEIKLAPRSAIGGALAGAALGGLLAGPIGALAVGAAAGGSPGVNNLIQLTYVKADVSYDLFFADADVFNKCSLLKQRNREN